MDGNEFDTLAIRIAKGSSRRSLFRAIGGGVLGALAGIVGVDVVDAASCRANGRTCSRDAQCCSSICGPKDRTNRQVCACPPGMQDCKGACKTRADYKSDPANCGSCGNRCPKPAHASAICAGGVCGFVCNPGYERCGDRCVKLTTEANCGGCGNSCTGGTSCVNGGCCQASIGGPCDSAAGGCCTGLCRNGFCDYADPGEPCDADVDCGSSICDEGRGRCSLLSPLDGPCDSDLDCAAGTCFDGTCRCCQAGGYECDDFSTYSVCCEWPSAAYMCCTQSGLTTCDAQEQNCIVTCGAAAPGTDCDTSATDVCPASHPVVFGCISAYIEAC